VKSSAGRVVGWAVAGLVAIGLGSPLQGQCVPADLNGDGLVDGADIGLLLLQWGENCPPTTVVSVAPSVGPLAGGIPIAIKGVGLDDVASVTIGGVPADHVVGVDSTTVIALVPPSKSIGSRDVVVTTTAGTATLSGGFLYSPVPWATILEESPDPKVVTDDDLRASIMATGLPWRVRDNASQIEMLLVPPGTFMMGCSPSLQYGCNSDENPVHQVTLTRPFYLGRYEVTQAEWTAVMGTNPSNFPDPLRPVEMVSWFAIQDFTSATGLRLPTEAEWEYACRAGTTTAFSNDNDDDATLASIAWFGLGNGTRVVGQKLPNPLGFHDMHGNVWEWVNDWYAADYYSQSPGIDPLGSSTGSQRVLRGGGWYTQSTSMQCRSSKRRPKVPGGNWPFNAADGFRAARTP
jgi:formylglycine-generating enzyme required for sulfatase activity